MGLDVGTFIYPPTASCNYGDNGFIFNFRKVSFLVGWLENHLQYDRELINCKDIHIPIKDIKILVQFCKSILYTFDNDTTEKFIQIAEKLLPITDGFLFNWYTDYNESYIKDLHTVIDLLDSAIQNEAVTDIVFHIWY